jgi:hypothetical protein
MRQARASARLCGYLDSSSKEVGMTFGFGSRHIAGGSISQQTNAIAIVVSESAIVRVFDEGNLQAELLPELWLLTRHGLHLQGRIHQDNLPNLSIFTSEESVGIADPDLT